MGERLQVGTDRERLDRGAATLIWLAASDAPDEERSGAYSLD
jgi:hypothetical protein